MGNKQKTVETLTIEELRELAAKFGKIKKEYENLISRLESHGIDQLLVRNTKTLYRGLDYVHGHYLAVARSIESTVVKPLFTRPNEAGVHEAEAMRKKGRRKGLQQKSPSNEKDGTQ